MTLKTDAEQNIHSVNLNSFHVKNTKDKLGNTGRPSAASSISILTVLEAIETRSQYNRVNPFILTTNHKIYASRALQSLAVLSLK